MMTSIPLSSARTSRAGVLAGWLGLIVLLALAIPTRVLNLEAFAGKFDEGIRGTQLMLMAAGYRPFRDIFASQGPLSLDIFYPTYMLFGQTLGAARMAPAIFSVVGVIVAAWTARQAAGAASTPSAGLAAGATAGLLLTVSPIFLKNSRLALVEVPSLVPAIAAVGMALAYGRGGDRRWLAGAGALMAVALAIKPMAAPALVPVGLAIMLRGLHLKGEAGRTGLPGRWSASASPRGRSRAGASRRTGPPSPARSRTSS
jgi:predicted membrane-bound mannosyltransferase